MVSVEQAKEIILNNTEVLDKIVINFPDIDGYVLAEDIRSNMNIPYFTNSAMDGFALSAQSTVNASNAAPVTLLIKATVKAGDNTDLSIKNGECVKIMTGAPIPEGADTVLRIEDAEIVGDSLVVRKKLPGNRDIRHCGEEVSIGDTALNSGTVVGPASKGFIAQLEIKSIRVYRKPSVGIVVTGEELVGAGEDLLPGKIVDTNSVALESACRADGTDQIYVERARDIKGDIKEKINSILELTDCVIVTGGVSVGEYDYVKEIFSDLEVRELFWKISQKPGGPMYFGTKGKKMVFGLPGNPASSLVCYYEYIRPALLKMMGRNDIHLDVILAELTEDLHTRPGKTRFIRGLLLEKEGKYYARSSGPQGSHMLKSFSNSNCLIVFPASGEYMKKGQIVKVHKLPL